MEGRKDMKVLVIVYVLCHQEIDHLRLQLSETKGRLQAAESVQQPNTPPLIDLEALCPSPLPENLSPSDNKVPVAISILLFIPCIAAATTA